MIKIIAAISLEGVIGVHNDGQYKLPWGKQDSVGDLKYFKDLTLNKTVIMGRNTYNSIGKELPQRRNIILTSKGIIVNQKLTDATGFDRAVRIAQAYGDDIYLIGGYNIYKDGLSYADEIILTVIPISVQKKFLEEDLIYFPEISDNIWKSCLILKHPYNEQLCIIKYRKCN